MLHTGRPFFGLNAQSFNGHQTLGGDVLGHETLDPLPLLPRRGNVGLRRAVGLLRDLRRKREVGRGVLWLRGGQV